MSLSEEHLDKGRQGAKRSSWAKLHYRDLALKVVADHPDAEIEDLSGWFLEELQKHPEFLESIAIYIMANVKLSLHPRQSPKRRAASIEDDIVESVAAKATVIVLMNLKMPSGKTLGESTGAECTKVGGWLKLVGTRVGPRGIVSKKLSEKDLVEILKKV